MDLLKIFSDNYIVLENVLDIIPDGIAVASSTRKTIYWNRAMKYLLADEPDYEAISHDWSRRYRLVHADTHQPLKYEELPLIRALNGEEFYDYRLSSINANFPEGINFSVNGAPIRSGHATVGGIVTFRDITKQISFEKSLAFEKHFYEGILDLLPGVVVIKDLDGRYLYGNKGMRKILASNDVIGKTAKEFFTKEEADILKAHDEEVVRSGRAIEFKEKIFSNTAHPYYLKTVRFPYRDQSGVIKGICLVVTDISH